MLFSFLKNHIYFLSEANKEDSLPLFSILQFKLSVLVHFSKRRQDLYSWFSLLNQAERARGDAEGWRKNRTKLPIGPNSRKPSHLKQSRNTPMSCQRNEAPKREIMSVESAAKSGSCWHHHAPVVLDGALLSLCLIGVPART